MRMFRLLFVVVLFSALFGGSPAAASIQEGPPDVAVPSFRDCGQKHAYTHWYRVNWYGTKPILKVWKGQGKGNPYYVSVWYGENYVPNSGSGIVTTSPQVDTNDGWVGYYISTRWYLTHPGWNNDANWEARGCTD